VRGAAFALVALVCLSGCHWGLAGVVVGAVFLPGPYHAETLARDLGPHAVRTLGCLDVGFAITTSNDRETLDVHVGNRCAHPEALDLSKLAIRGVDGRGEPQKIALRDPRREIAELHVGGSQRGKERFRLVSNSNFVPRRICLDVDRIAPDAPAARPAAICFEPVDDGWRASNGEHS
jgi:hypothetical protein